MQVLGLWRRLPIGIRMRSAALHERARIRRDGGQQ
jgi:hypothetical protein